MSDRSAIGQTRQAAGLNNPSENKPLSTARVTQLFTKTLAPFRATALRAILSAREELHAPP